MTKIESVLSVAVTISLWMAVIIGWKHGYFEPPRTLITVMSHHILGIAVMSTILTVLTFIKNKIDEDK